MASLKVCLFTKAIKFQGENFKHLRGDQFSYKSKVQLKQRDFLRSEIRKLLYNMVGASNFRHFFKMTWLSDILVLHHEIGCPMNFG